MVDLRLSLLFRLVVFATVHLPCRFCGFFLCAMEQNGYKMTKKWKRDLHIIWSSTARLLQVGYMVARCPESWSFILDLLTHLVRVFSSLGEDDEKEYIKF